MKVLLVCERSGGHIFPALAIGKKMRHIFGEDESKIYYFATAAVFRDYLKNEGFTVFGKSFPLRILFFEIPWRMLEALYLLVRLRPQKVIGFGGRDSFFLLLFSSFFGRDTAIYEPNAKFGKANKVLSFFAKQVLFGFPQEREIKNSKTIGILLRDNIKKIDKTKAKEMLGFDGRPVIFCFGGSQGSSFLNRIMIELIPHLREKCQFIHLTGERDYFEISQIYKKMEAKSFVKDFYYPMEVLYSAADLVVSRAGASTVGELTYYQVPSILIPHPLAGGHQKDNAFYLEERESARVFLQDKFLFD
ncbi:MAG: UDP-N-acetylglucosamine--N-acetylmuramyl-(pentapeptide) pyrophosphoryl-undecaprenol N-acetylglucosamine transferase [Candidatus Omnitrophota bacterium]|nr:MAG: UDP-N-acetylglucosamine--N-acetylmuramyl-(pentapeptide) pyrophosphoryl-undecaprenol N-acetylglucosamine transferase [Candidatus Omnitrophota bacterium]